MATTLTPQTIAVDINVAASLVNSLTPLLSSYFPAVGSNQQLISIGTSAAQSLAALVSSIPISTGTITVQQQAALLSKIYSLLAGSELANPEWKIQT